MSRTEVPTQYSVSVDHALAAGSLKGSVRVLTQDLNDVAQFTYVKCLLHQRMEEGRL